MTDFLDTLLGYQLRRASAAMIADLTADIAALGLSVSAMSVLFTIADGQAAGADEDGSVTLVRTGRSQSEIGRILGIQRANMAPLAAVLEHRGFIEREDLDGRSHVLLLTKAGRAMAARARRIVQAHEARFMPDLLQAERAGLVRMLGRIWQR